MLAQWQAGQFFAKEFGVLSDETRQHMLQDWMPVVRAHKKLKASGHLQTKVVLQHQK